MNKPAIEMTEKPVMDENADPSVPANPPKDYGDDDTSDFDFDTFATKEEVAGDEADETAVEGEESGKETKPEPKPATAEEPKPETKVKETPPAAQQTPPTEAKPAETQPAAVEPPKTEEAPQPTQEELNQQYQDWFNRGSDFLAENVYKLDDETKAKLDSNPSEVMPRLAAQLHMQVLAAATTQAANLFVTMAPQMQQRQIYEKSLEDDFYGTYEALKPHKQVVGEIARAYRQMYPDATPAQVKQTVAAMAMVQLQIVPPSFQQQQTVQNVVPAAVTPTSAGAPGAVAQPQGTGEKSWLEEIIEED